MTRVTAYPLSGTDSELIGELDLGLYSRMKHGDLDAIDALAAVLHERLVDAVPELLTAPIAPTFPVAYLAVPPSCFYLAAALVERLSARRVLAGLAPARVVKVDKDSVTHSDYASASQAEREAELSRIGFRLAEPIDGSICVVVDDVRVTGMAERTILRALAAGSPARLVTAYVAACDAQLAASPHVEAALNGASVTSILDLLPAVRAGRFALTIRFLKRALASPDLERFVATCPDALVRELRDGAIATGPQFVAGYPSGMAVLDDRLAAGRICLARLTGDGLGEEAASYSRFKHGDGSVAGRYGAQLADAYLARADVGPDAKLHVTSSAYLGTRPAAWALVEPFVARLRAVRPDVQVDVVRLERATVSQGDYAAMTPAQRSAAIGGGDLRAPAGLSGAHVVALDDIRVTGTHERAVDECLRRAGVAWIDHLYVVDAHDAADSPEIEARLNEIAVPGLSQIVTLSARPEFVPNARVARRILGDPVVAAECAQVAPALARWVLAAGLADGLADVPAYAPGLWALQAALDAAHSLA